MFAYNTCVPILMSTGWSVTFSCLVTFLIESISLLFCSRPCVFCCLVQFLGEAKSFCFCKWPGSHNHHEGGIIHHAATGEVDYECELVIVIGKQGINISREDAMDYIYGYTIMNEVSARDIQVRNMQWFRGKALDTFGPLGPWIVTKDETGDGNNLNVISRVNGEVRQNSNTNDMIFDLATVISVISEGFSLYPGDLIATGTPEGVGFAMDPPRLMKVGEVVECEIENIGVLRNKVVAP